MREFPTLAAERAWMSSTHPLADAIGEVAEPRETVEDIEDDPDDNRVLEAAAEGDAGLIVSGDRHLLSLGTWRGMSVVTPAGFPEQA